MPTESDFFACAGSVCVFCDKRLVAPLVMLLCQKNSVYESTNDTNEV